MLGQPAPAAADQEGTFYTFEKGVQKTGGGQGFADVWLRGHFAWEYKKRQANLDAAYRQLLTYRENLENPPLLVVCDLNHFAVHTNFTNTVTRVYTFSLADLARGDAVDGSWLSPLEVLRSLFTNPEQLRPQQTTAQVTEAAAREFAQLAASLSIAGADPEQSAHFLMRLLFCLFAQDIQLLPSKLLTRLVESTNQRPADFRRRLQSLFEAMASGGYFGADDIAHFNGGLFADDSTLDLTRADLGVLARACRLNWASVEPAIFGTLFERSLDPAKRAQLGAHYTSRDDILLIVEPVLMAPLRREWADLQQQALTLVAKRDAASGPARLRQQDALRRLLVGFSSKLSTVRVLDPACGSGNFLYVALKQLLDLEKAVITFAAQHGLTTWFPQVKPEQLYGIEVNPYAHELAQVVVWIGYLQWLHDNGFATVSGTILRRLDNIKAMDAILGHDEQGRPIEPEWPEADIIIGNPPFLGDKRMRGELGDAYAEQVRALYGGRVPGGADLVTYWFELARAQIVAGKTRRVGLLATNSIRQSGNRPVLERIKASGGIFMAWGDRPWVLNGASVRVSMVGFDNGTERGITLDGVPVSDIHSDLTATADITRAVTLVENRGYCFLGMMKAGPFDLDGAAAQAMLAAPVNTNGRPNRDVVKHRLIGRDITARPRDAWVIDFGVSMSEHDASQYELPFEYVRRHVKPLRDENRRDRMRLRWWIYGEARPGLRQAIKGLRRCIVTPEVAKHRLFIWMSTDVIPDHTLHVIARDDDYCFGVLQSRVHEIWSLKQGARMGVGNDPRYSSQRTFETFPFPWPPGQEPPDDPRVQAIAGAAQELVRKRDAWLNPPDASAEELRRRTLTNLYNQRPTWLDLAHRTLDQAVLDAYGWPHELSDEEILSRLLGLNLERAAARANASEAASDGR